MASDLFSADISNFLEKALESQLAEPEKPLTEARVKEIARTAGLSADDWENLCEKLKRLLARGRNFLQFGNYSDAATELENAAAIAPYRADVLVDCGKAHFGRWRETKARASKERAETLFIKALEIDPENTEAAKQLSDLKKERPPSRVPRKAAALAAALLLSGGVLAWVGIPALSGKSDHGAAPQIESSLPSARVTYPPGELPPTGETSPLAFDDTLVAHWSFDGSGTLPLLSAGTIEATAGVDGNAVRFFPDRESGMYTEPATKTDLVESITVSAWVKPSARRGGQIIWFGDRRSGRDPWHLSILGNGQVRFRTDRSVSSRPGHAVEVDEIMTHSDGSITQHITAESPGVLPLNEWSFITGRIEKISATDSVITLFVNGTRVATAQTNEAFDYGTENMWIALGSVHQGESQNFDGAIDEVRIYGSALSDDEILEIYQLPRRIPTGN
jgi:hypothetical protein